RSLPNRSGSLVARDPRHGQRLVLGGDRLRDHQDLRRAALPLAPWASGRATERPRSRDGCRPQAAGSSALEGRRNSRRPARTDYEEDAAMASGVESQVLPVTFSSAAAIRSASSALSVCRWPATTGSRSAPPCTSSTASGSTPSTPGPTRTA